MSPEKDALIALRRMRAKLEELERARTEPIAIVGLGCRFPGGAVDGESFWRLLDEGRDAISEVPPSRWDLESYFDPDPEASGKIATRYGGFLPDIEKFDAAFFGISPREAVPLDPQQRLVLEVSWEALESGGQAPDRLAGSATGVFLGVSTNDYAHLQIAGDPREIDAYFGTGVALASMAGRVSYVLGLSGPSLVVDTACSSSLVSVHLAAQSLRARECDLALAGGVNVILSPEVSVAFSRAQMMARDGRCKTFDASADGYVRSEGCGIVVLKRLSDALASQDRILALVRGSAVNQDGRSTGFTAPNEGAQRAVILRALANAGLAPSSVSYVEAHGTGTKLGDPIELQALAAALGEGRSAEDPLVVGSVKTNVGHLEAAAGVAGLIKVVLSLQNERIPPHLHFHQPNPYVAWDEIPISIPARGRAWPKGDRPRIAGVSSFGFTGTNAHIVLEEAPEEVPSAASARPLQVLTLSARTETALVELAKRFSGALEAEGTALADASYTANSGRARLPHRLAVVAGESREAAAKLADFASGRKSEGLLNGRVSRKSPKIAFLFSGQGSQYPGMGKELFASEPIFREALERCDRLLRPHLDRPLLSVLYPEADEGALDETVYTQPALFALEHALFELWRSWGVEPAYVMGHSVGEYVAAWASGVFDLEEGLRLVAARGRLMQSLPEDGRMAAVFCDEGRARARLSGSVAVAAINGPSNVVLSGPEGELGSVLSELERDGVSWRELSVRRAFHAPSVEAILDRFEEEVSRASFSRPRLGLISNLTGELADSELASASYWRSQLREPVQFRRSIETLMKKGCDVVLELGPSTTLSAMGLECAPGTDGLWVSSLRKGRSDWSQILESLAALHVRGVEIDWDRFDSRARRRRVALPTYPFERERFWISRAPREVFAREEDWFYEIDWQEAGPRDIATRFFPDRSRIVRVLDDASTELGRACGIEIYEELLPAMHGLAAEFVVSVVEELGLLPRIGESFTASSTASRFGVVERHHQLWRRLLGVLEEEGFTERLSGGDEWRWVRRPEPGSPKRRSRSLRQELPAGEIELALLEACGESLASVLRGESDPLEILFPEGGLSRIEGLYRHTPAARFFNSLVQRAVAEALAELPKGVPVRVLELGAGTGGTTASVLPVLPLYGAEYLFTDVSPLFLERAKESFPGVPFLSFGTLDLERDPVEQGFLRGGFDIVIGANVVHATKDLRASLRHARDLLAPGGLLLLLEVVEQERFSDLTVGLTEGWWRFEDRDLRKSGPLLGKSEWSALLADEGFSDVALSSERLGSRILAKQSLLWARRSGAAAAKTAGVSRSFVIFSDRNGTGSHLAEIARAEGHQVLEVEQGADPSNVEDYERLLRPLEGDMPRELVYLWGLDPPSEREIDELGFTAYETRTLGPLLRLTEALVGQPQVETRLWLVTRGAQEVTSGKTTMGLEGLAGAPLWGLGRVFALEHPQLWGGLLDVAGSPYEAASCLLREIAANDGEDQVAFRGATRSVARLRRAPLDGPEGRLELRSDGSYWISGGLGRLGLHLARFLVDRGARHLVLLGRTGLPEPGSALTPGSEEERRSRSVAELRSLGASVEVVVADVSDLETLESVARKLDEAGRPLRGVAHAAMILDSRALRDMTESELRSVLMPKIDGAWALHRLKENREIDFFLLFSSSTGILGVSGLGHYAAANQFLDALARYRRARGLPATSVSWGTWEEMRRTSEEEKRRSREGGLLPLPTARALALVDRVVRSGRAHLMVASVDWAKLKPVYEARRKRPFLERFEVAPARETGGEPEKKIALTSEYLEREVARTLGLADGARLDPLRPLSEMGLDSLMAVKLKNRIESDLGIAVTIRNLLAGVTLAELARSVRSPDGSDGAGGEERLERRGEREGVLSYSQERFWFLDQLEPGSSLYANPAIFRIRGNLDAAALSRGLDRIRERHEILRTRFALVDGEPRQIVTEPAPFPLRVVDLRSAGDERDAKKLTQEELARPFDLRAGALVRATLFRLAPEDHLLAVNMHHAVSDGWSYRVFLKELGVFYRAAVNGEGRPRLEPLPVQYTDFARWQRRSMSGEAMERQLSYWKRQLAGSPPLLKLPTDFPRPPVQRFRGGQVEAEIEPSLRRSLEELSRREGATLFMTLLAAFGLLLHRFTGETDIPIGSPIAGRHRAEIENSIGVFLNYLVFRSDLSGDPSFRELLGRVRRVALEGYANQDLPFEKLLSELVPERDLSKTPLFQVFFNMANLPDYPSSIAGLDLDYLFSALAESKFDLTLYAAEGRGTYPLVLVYNADLFEEATARQLLSSFHRLLHAVSEHPEERLSRLPLFADEEAARGRKAAPPPSLGAGEGFRPFAEGGSDESVASRFRRIASARADCLAVSTPARRFSYRELDRWSNGGARAVLEACPARADRVALLFDHDAPMVAGVMAAVKAGRTYVPLDPGYPRERLSTLLADCGARAILTEGENLPLARELSEGRLPVVDIDRVSPSSESSFSDALPDDVAYILYTSGSTGEPKGVMQSYRNLLHHAGCYTDNLRIGAGDRLSLLASYTFDAAVMDLYGALLNGAALYPYDVRERGVEGLGAFLDRESITLYHSTPTVFRHFLRAQEGRSRHPSLRAVVLGGEEVHRADVDRFRAAFSPSTVLVNGLGPTESTLALQFFVPSGTPMRRMRVPVGFPVAGTEVLLLSESGAAGQVYGEIAIRSPFVALGYFRRDELTRAAFAEPGDGNGARVYRTGDLGRLLPDGSIEFLGRRDSQVKVRGFRIELEEVETHLERHPGVREAVVIDRMGDGGDRALVAFVVPRNGRSIASSDLRRFLAERLPGFMVPARFQAIPAIPLTATGKVDRRALACIELADAQSESSEPPRTPTENALAAAWRRILSVERVTRGDNFFELGGHSLLLTQLALAIRTGFGVDFPLRSLFHKPSVAEMAAFIDSEREKKGSGREKTPILRLSRDAHRIHAGSRDPAAVSELLKRRS